MSFNVIDLIKGQLGPATTTQVATQLNESETGVSKAINALLSAVVGGMAYKANNPTLLTAIQSAKNGGFLDNILSGSTNNTLLQSVIDSIFGNKTSDLTNSVASFAGINNSSANALLATVVTAVIGSLGKYASDKNLDDNGISNLLAEQKGNIASLLPAGFSLAAFGIGATTATPVPNPVDTAAKTTVTENIEVTRTGQTHVTAPVKEEEKSSIWKWLLPLILLAILAFFLFRNCDNKKEITTTTVETETVQTDTVASNENREVRDIILNEKTIFKGYINGLEEQLINFLKDGKYETASEETLKDTWYNFDNVNFVIGSSTELLPDSINQIENLAKILQQFPNAKIVVRGHTDKTGPEDLNQQLSKDRAKFIEDKLIEFGVNENQIDRTKGVGSEYASVPASATNTERATDRIMAIRFTK